MKKLLIAFGLGQALQIALVWIGEKMTYSTNLLAFSAGVGIVVFIAAVVGTLGTLLELAVQENNEMPDPDMDYDESLGSEFRALFKREDMDEVAELPNEIEVTNTHVKRA